MKRLRHVLLIEDDEITNYINEKLIKKLDFSDKIESVQNGYEGLSNIKALLQDGVSCPELIFLDINMPVMDGFEFLEEFRKLKITPEVAVITLTTSSHIKDIEKLSRLGSTDFLTKPLTEEKLAKMITKHFAEEV